MAADSDNPRCVVYCRSWCGDCHRAIRWLDANGVDYELIDIEKTPAARETVVAIAGKVVTPTFEIGDQTCVDFDEARLKELLGK